MILREAQSIDACGGEKKKKRINRNRREFVRGGEQNQSAVLSEHHTFHNANHYSVHSVVGTQGPGASEHQWRFGLCCARLTRNLRRNNGVYEAGCSHGGLTEHSVLLFLHGHRLAQSLLPTRRTALPAARRVLRLGRQQVLRAAGGGGGGGGVGSRVHPPGAGGGQLGLRLGGGAELLLHVLGHEASAALSSLAHLLLLLGQAGVHGGGVGVWEDAGPLEVARVALVAAWPGGQRPGRPNKTHSVNKQGLGVLGVRD